MSAPPKKMGLSLYADLLDPEKAKAQGTTISGAPVKYDVKKETDEEVQKKKDASLKFQPIRRPQVQQKSKSKPATSSSVHKFSSSTVTASASSPNKQTLASTPQQQASFQKSNFEDWVGDDDDEYYYQDRSRGNKKKKKKNKGGQEARVLDWDDIYDPTRPNNYADYKGSEEQYREIRDWKARLYYHQLKEAKRKGQNGAAHSDGEEPPARPMNRMFAPPSNLNFAPPTFDDAAHPAHMDDDDDYYPSDKASSYNRPDSDTYERPPSFAPSIVADDPTGEDAYMRRMRMSGTMPKQAPPSPPPAFAQSVPTPPPIVKQAGADVEAKRAEAQAKIAAFKAKLQKPTSSSPNASTEAMQSTAMPQTTLYTQSAGPTASPPPPPPAPATNSAATISRAPVRYEVPPPPLDDAGTEQTHPDEAGNEPSANLEAEQPKSRKPGQKGFAERLLNKYGWEKGQGLGAQGEGITTALVGKAEKRKKLSDREGGGWAQPANMGKIVGGKRRKLENQDDEAVQDARFGKMSEVIKLEGMLKGLDVQKEIEENNLMQEIGDEMGSKYGNVERVFIWRQEMGGQDEVFIKFTSQLSATRAVNDTDGMTFAENDVAAKFWDVEKFENGEYA